MLALEFIPAKSMDVQSATPGNVIALFPQLAKNAVQLLPCLLLTKPVSKSRKKKTLKHGWMLSKVTYHFQREEEKINHSINPGKTPPPFYPLHTCHKSEWKPSPRTHVDTSFTETLVVCQNQFLETSSNSTHMICVSPAIKSITLTSKSAAPVHYSNIRLEETNYISNSVHG